MEHLRPKARPQSLLFLRINNLLAIYLFDKEINLSTTFINGPFLV